MAAVYMITRITRKILAVPFPLLNPREAINPEPRILHKSLLGGSVPLPMAATNTTPTHQHSISTPIASTNIEAPRLSRLQRFSGVIFRRNTLPP
ncbi:hypothetical protein H0H87_006110, partial [Tephrocybe sp. NHM501043]